MQPSSGLQPTLSSHGFLKAKVTRIWTIKYQHSQLWNTRLTCDLHPRPFGAPPTQILTCLWCTFLLPRHPEERPPSLPPLATQRRPHPSTPLQSLLLHHTSPSPGAPCPPTLKRCTAPCCFTPRTAGPASTLTYLCLLGLFQIQYSTLSHLYALNSCNVQDTGGDGIFVDNI